MEQAIIAHIAFVPSPVAACYSQFHSETDSFLFCVVMQTKLLITILHFYITSFCFALFVYF